MALQIRRGTEAQRAVLTGVAGELLYTTDTKKLYVGDGVTAGGTEVAIDLTAPGAIGSVTPGTGDFTTLTSSTSLDIGSTIAITGVLDEDNMSSDSAVKLATQQSIKAYVDAASTTFAAGSAAAPSITTTGDTDTGVFFSAANTVDVTTDGTARAQFDSSGNFKYNSGYGSVATAYGCRAWVNFNGTGAPAIRASGNVTSITDNGVGDYTVNFTVGMPDANFVVVGNAKQTVATSVGNGNVVLAFSASTSLTSSARVHTAYTNSAVDAQLVQVAIFR